jgi:anaerobic magnesium-protoporphyrin IX monomethyl ester cyclase
VLLLNPPGTKVYLRDYYCSKVSKSNYLYHPVDLLMVSGRLAGRHELHVLDAIADRVGAAECRSRIERLAPDVIIAQIGAVSLSEDESFLASLVRPGRRIIVSGDVVLEDTARWLDQHAFIDGVLLDFTSEDIITYVEGAAEPLRGIVQRSDPASAAGRTRPENGEYAVPVPRHDLFTSPFYRYPFVRRKPFATVLTDYGCPYRCSFCVMSRIGHQTRPVENVLEELRFLKSLGTRDIYFDDQTFGVNRKRTVELCDRMRHERLGFGWVCFSRADLLDTDLVAVMQEAGCHTIMMGVESADEGLLRKYRKGITKEQVRNAFHTCAVRGVRTVATFILGLPEDTEDTMRETVAFARELDCDFASFNIAVPRMGTPLRQEAIRDGLISADLMTMDQTGSSIAMPTKHLSRDQLKKFRNEAIRDFYLRPRYLWRRLRGVSSWYELREHLSEGWALLRSSGS